MKFPLVLLLSLSYSAGSLAGNWDRIMLWGWDGKSPKAFGSLEPAPNRNGCYGDEITNPDKAMVFDVTKLAKMAGSSFDVHNIYVDSVGEDGGYALGTWINHWHSKGYGYELVPEGQHWESSQSKVLVCVGTTVWAWIAAQYLSLGPLKKIFLWYKKPVPTTVDNTPDPGQPVHSPTNARNMANTDDALRVSKNGLTLRDLHQTPPAGTAPGSISGPRVDLEPDFDVYDTNGVEISANCNNCMGKSVDVGQTVHAKLKTEVTITFGRDDTAARGIPFLLYF